MTKWYDKDDGDFSDRKRNKSRPKDEYRRKSREKRDSRFAELMERDDSDNRRYGDE